MDKIVPTAEHFGFSFNNVHHLSWKARHLDRQLANELTREDWQAAADYLQGQMTDECIEQALSSLPTTIRSISGAEIEAKLKQRRGELKSAANELYRLLARQVDVVGSNKREIFEVKRLANGAVEVWMYDWEKESGGKGKLLYHRQFLPSDTKAIHLFGLGDEDEFYVSGEAERSILLRIIGGKGRDVIRDSSYVKKGKRQTIVYDTHRKDSLYRSKETRVMRPKLEARYCNNAFEYNRFVPFPKFRVSPGNGFGIELRGTYYAQGFNKPEFGTKTLAKLIFYPSLLAHRFDLRHWWRHLVGQQDLQLHLRGSTLYDNFPFFYGIGNESQRDIELAENTDFYRINYNTIQFALTLERQFLRKSSYQIGLQYQYNNVSPLESSSSIFDFEANRQLHGIGKQHQTGLIATFNLDFRDHPTFTRNGSQLYLDHYLLFNLSQNAEAYAQINAYIAHYTSFRLGLPMTLALRLGGSRTYGPAPFYHLSPLGNNAYLRTYVRNRFLGTESAYANSELRFHLGVIRTPLIPIKWGVYGFADAGRVWADVHSSRDYWHTGIGGGLYAAPLQENFNFIMVLGQNREKEWYFSFGTGFNLQ